MVTSVTFSTKKQTSITDRFTMFVPENRWRLDADHRFQWTSLDTYDSVRVPTRMRAPSPIRFLQAASHGLLSGASRTVRGRGPLFRQPHQRRPRRDEEAAWTESPYVKYSQAHGLPLDSQIAAGTSVESSGTIATASSTPITDGWPRRAIERCSTASSAAIRAGRSQPRRADLRERLARSPAQDSPSGTFADLVVGGVAPFLDLPSTAGDTYGRSARGYAEGQFRGERLAYGEIEYRATLMRNGLLGMVAFLNTTTVSSLDQGERLFDSFATGGGAGVRLLINKRSKTNLCLDVGFGKQGKGGIPGHPGSLLSIWMRRTRLFWAIGVALVTAVAIASQGPPAGALPETLRARVKNERLEVVTSIRGLPLGVREALQALFGSQSLDIAEPGAEFQATDDVGARKLPIRRLVAAGCSTEYCLVYYERGGIAHTWQVALFHWTPAATRFEWGGTAPASLATLDEVRKAVLSGAVRSPNSVW